MSWDDLEKKKTEQPTPEQVEWARLHSSVFATGPGADLLERYHRMIVDSVAGPSASEAELRFREGQRAIIRQMELLTRRGA